MKPVTSSQGAAPSAHVLSYCAQELARLQASYSRAAGDHWDLSRTEREDCRDALSALDDAWDITIDSVAGLRSPQDALEPLEGAMRLLAGVTNVGDLETLHERLSALAEESAAAALPPVPMTERQMFAAAL